MPWAFTAPASVLLTPHSLDWTTLTSVPSPLWPTHTHEHGHMGTPCRYKCVSSINPMPALLAGQDMGLQLTKCPPDPGHLWVALPYQYHRSPRGQTRSCTPNYSACHSSERKAVLPSFINVPTKVSESESESCLVMSDSLWPHGLYSPWNSPGQNTGVGSLSLLQGSFQPRDQTQVSHIAGGFFTSWATREAQEYWLQYSGVRFQRESIFTSSPSQKVAELRFKPRNPNSYFYYL